MEGPARPFPSLRRVAASILLAASLAGPIPVIAPAVSAATPPGDCLEPLPTADVEPGMTGTGWSTVSGTDPVPFAVTVLGVYLDAVAPGRDIILVRVADVDASTIMADAGGIWAGISGSPVVIDGKLAGSLSWRFADGPSFVGGLTPAAELLRIADYPQVAGDGTLRTSGTRLSSAFRHALDALPGVDAAEAASFERIPVPLTVSGLNARGRRVLARDLGRSGLAFVVARGGRRAAPANGATPLTPVPGGNLAALYSYGDVTAGAIGSVTWVCEGMALGFGHPLSLTGPSTVGANGASTIVIAPDPLWGPWKVVNIGGVYGTVDQDRLAGLRVDLDLAPALTPVAATVHDTDLGRERTGTSWVTVPDWVSSIAPQHLYADLIATTDREGKGSGLVRFDIEGIRSGGAPWSVTIRDRLTTEWSIQWELANRLDEVLRRIVENGFDEVTVTGVDAEAWVTIDRRLGSIEEVRGSVNGGPWLPAGAFRAAPGQRIDLEIDLVRRGASEQVVELTLTAPSGARGVGRLTITGSGGTTGCTADPAGCASTFDGFLAGLATAPRADAVVATLRYPNGATVTRIGLADLVVTGSARVNVPQPAR